MLNKTISSTAIFDLIQYKRILFYKQINPDYVACYSVNQIASQVKKLTAGFSGSSSSSSFDPPATRTTTTTTSISTTTTTSSTTTTTTTIKVINCGTSSTFPGGVAYPTTQSITLGSVIGTVVLSYNTQGIPERFIVEWNNNVVIDTGYRGSNAYNFGEAARASFNSFLTGKTDPISGLQYPLTPGGSPPNQILADGYPSVSLPLAGTASFEKNLADSVSATVKVYSPVDSNIGWAYTLTCPVPTTTTTTSSTTTTTTTLPPEQFRIQAIDVDEIGRLNNPAGMKISSSSIFKIIWEPGVENTYGPGNDININHTYTIPRTGDIIIQAVDLTNITSLIIESDLHLPDGRLSVTTEEIAKLDGLLTFRAELQGNAGVNVTGIVSDLPDSLLEFTTVKTTITGTTGQFPPNLVTCRVEGSSVITGIANALPKSIRSLIISGGNLISGDVGTLPGGASTPLPPGTMVNCVINGFNTLTGNTADLPKPTGLLIITGNNEITGDIANLSKAVQVEILGKNTISGNISGFSGVGGLLSPTTVILRIGGVLPGGNTISGNINDFPKNLVRLEISGKSALSGSLSNLPTTNLTSVSLISTLSIPNNTFSGIANSLPNLLTSVQLSSTGLFEGDLFDLPSGIVQFNLGMNTDLSYNLVTTRDWAANFFSISIPPTTGTAWDGFTAAETDKLLIDISDTFITTSNLTNRFTLRCADDPKRTVASNAAFDFINGKLALVGNAIVLYPVIP
jgi:hypothetical protein